VSVEYLVLEKILYGHMKEERMNSVHSAFLTFEIPFLHSRKQAVVSNASPDGIVADSVLLCDLSLFLLWYL